MTCTLNCMTRIRMTRAPQEMRCHTVCCCVVHGVAAILLCLLGAVETAEQPVAPAQVPAGAEWRLLAGGSDGVIGELSAAQLDSLRKAPKVAIGWSFSHKSGGEMSSKELALSTYEHTVEFSFGAEIASPPDPPQPVMPPYVGRRCSSRQHFVPVAVECTSAPRTGDCGVPKLMYWGSNAGSTCWGQAIGLVAPPAGDGSMWCDWLIDQAAYQAVYLSRCHRPFCCSILRHGTSRERVVGIKTRHTVPASST